MKWDDPKTPLVHDGCALVGSSFGAYVEIGAGSRVEKDQTPTEDEISPEALESVSLAGARFDWFLQRVSAEG